MTKVMTTITTTTMTMMTKAGVSLVTVFYYSCPTVAKKQLGVMTAVIIMAHHHYLFFVVPWDV